MSFEAKTKEKQRFNNANFVKYISKKSKEFINSN